jgi:hypothetical protein
MLTRLVVVAALAVSGSFGCVTSFDVAPSPDLSPHTIPGLQSAGSSSIASQVGELERKCDVYSFKLENEAVDAKNSEAKVKTIIGATTGLIGTIGGGSTVASAADSGDNKGRTEAIGITTAALTAVGTVLVAVLTPGAATIEANKDRLAKIAADKTALMTFLNDAANADTGQWSDPQNTRYQTLVGALKADCEIQP